MSLSIIIPVYNEKDQIKNTLKKLVEFKKIINDLYIIIVDDQSTDKTYYIVKKFAKRKKFIKIYSNPKKGLGSAIETGIRKSKSKYLSIFMSDMSDSLKDLKKYYKLIQKNNVDAVFGTRFSKKSTVYGYPMLKLFLNRIFNNFVRIIFFSKYNDFTNAFKIYNRKSLLQLMPIVSENFNVFLELPLKIIVRKYSYTITSINWRKRTRGSSKFEIRELGSMYLFTLLYCLFEKILLNKKK